MKITSIHYCRKIFSFKMNNLSTTDNIFNDKWSDILYTGYLNLNYIGGGGVKFAPQEVFCCSSKTVGPRLLKLCGYYCYPITHHLVYFLVTRDLSYCHGNPILNRCLAKK